jgi:uncharacterized protein YndB with AHSA1/START domain
MIGDANYSPGPATMARVDKSGEKWTLVVTKQLRHAPQVVWTAITDPAQLREWAPFDADGNLAVAGNRVMLTTVGAPGPHITEARVVRADMPHLLEYNWGDFNMRWQLEPVDGGTRLTLWTNIDRRYMAMGAAGWHICFDVLDRMLAGAPIGRTVGPDVMHFEGWQRLHAEYRKQFESEGSAQ